MTGARLALLAGHLLRPAQWVERARGRSRRLLGTSLTLALVVAGLFCWRASRLRGLPDRGEPFDARDLANLSVPDDRNAFVLYEQAAKLARPNQAIEIRILNGPWKWPAGDDEALAYFDANREALETWRRGTERPDALLIPPADARLHTSLATLQDHRHFARMAMLEASRLRDAGDLAGAWTWCRAILRASRHAGRHSLTVGRLVGVAEYGMATTAATAWMADPRVDPPLLRRAMADILAADALATSNAEPIQIEHMVLNHAFDDPAELLEFLIDDPWDADYLDKTDWRTHLRALRRANWFLSNEPESSRRIARLLTANWLAHCDDPPALRPPWVGTPEHPRMLYDAPESAGLPSAASLAAQAEASEIVRPLMLAYDSYQLACDRERAQRAALIMALANRLYEVEHGEPAPSDDALIGPCLTHFPDGYTRPPDP